jgi:hypothetical protein
LLKNTFIGQVLVKQGNGKDFIMQNCSVKQLQAGKIYNAELLLRSGYKQERFYNAGLLC